jgi:hydroxymethylbilane synthase
VSRGLGGSCSMPLAAHATWAGEELVLQVALGHPERTDAPLLRHACRAAVQQLDDAEALGAQAADALRQSGAADYLAAAGADERPSD